jgi:hypothetical protein
MPPNVRRRSVADPPKREGGFPCGQRMMDRTFLVWSILIRSGIMIPNTAVVPVSVYVWPIMSFPSRTEEWPATGYG